LIVESENGPIGVCYKEEGRFEVKIEARLEASWLEGDIRKDDSWEGLLFEIDNE
jgi:hypothetical protein